MQILYRYSQKIVRSQTINVFFCQFLSVFRQTLRQKTDNNFSDFAALMVIMNKDINGNYEQI